MTNEVTRVDNTVFPPHFYKVPTNAPALFSTRRGTIDKKPLLDPLPFIVLRSNDSVEIQAKAALLRKQFPDIAMQVLPPSRWEDLYKYFDAADLWTEGTWFCYYVLCDLGEHNVLARKEVAEACRKEVDLWASQWVGRNEALVLENRNVKNMLVLLSEEDIADVKDLSTYHFEWLRESLVHHRTLLLRKKHVEGYRLPSSSMPTPSSTPRIPSVTPTLAPARQPQQPEHNGMMFILDNDICY